MITQSVTFRRELRPTLTFLMLRGIPGWSN